jgi:hypothetical protein
MQFSFRDAPGWFNEYIMDEFLDELHGAIEQSFKHTRDIDKLLDFAVEFFTDNGLCVTKRDQQVWFNIDKTDLKWLWPILKWSD